MMSDQPADAKKSASANRSPLAELVLTISNADRLVGTTSFTQVFGPSGGTIGSGDSVTWSLDEGANGRTEPLHAEIKVIEGAYCLLDRSKSGTFINGAATRCEPDQPVRLNSGDRIRIGALDILVDLNESADDPFQDSARQADGLDEVTTSNPYREVAPGTASRNPVRHNPLLDGGNPADVDNRRAEPVVQSKTSDSEPLMAFPDSESEMRLERDPLALFDRAGVASDLRADQDALVREDTTSTSDQAGESAQVTVQPNDLTGSIHAAAIATPLAEDEGQQSGANVDPDAMAYLAALEEHDGSHSASAHGASPDSAQAIDHVALRPLLKALGIDIQTMDAAQAEQFLTEIGLVVRETVAAMVELYASAPGHGPVESRLNASTVLPLEDNPMRLATNVDEGMENLFFIQNPVQLSPSDAIRECFSQIKDHQRFTETAADQGLQSALKVFDPSVLSQRFHAYAQARRDPRPRDAAWHWDMYQKYYTELNAKRQDGLRRIFWQVFERAYDQSVRNQPSIF